MVQKWHVELNNAAHKKIKMVLRSTRVSMEAKKRAQILLDLDESNDRKPESLSVITSKRGVCENTIINVRRNYAESGIDAAIFRKKRKTPPVTPKVTGEVEAHMHWKCQQAILNPNADTTEFEAKARRKITSFRERLVPSHVKTTA